MSDMPSEEERAKKILDALIDMWYQKILDKMCTGAYPDFDTALEEVKMEMLNEK